MYNVLQNTHSLNEQKWINMYDKIKYINKNIFCVNQLIVFWTNTKYYITYDII